MELPSQRYRAIALLSRNGMMRTGELVNQGVAATTLARMEQDGSILRLSRGLYQLADAPTDTNHDLAEAASRHKSVQILSEWSGAPRYAKTTRGDSFYKPPHSPLTNMVLTPYVS